MAQKSKNKVKIKFLLIGILKAVGSGESQADIARRYGWSKQRMNYWFNKLERGGFIERKERSSFVIYELGAEVKKLTLGMLNGSESGIRLHNIGFSYPIISSGVMEYDKTWKMRGLLMSSKRLKNSTLTVSGNTLNVLIGSLVGENPFELEHEAIKMAESVADFARSKGFELGEGRMVRKPHFAIINPIVKRIAKDIQFSSDTAKIDESEGEGELEYFNAENVESFISMPSRMVNVERMIEKQSSIMDEFSDNIATHTQVIKSMVVAMDELRDGIKELKDVVKDTKR